MKNNTAPPPPIAPTIPRMVDSLLELLPVDSLLELLPVEVAVSGFEIRSCQILIT